MNAAHLDVLYIWHAAFRLVYRGLIQTLSLSPELCKNLLPIPNVVPCTVWTAGHFANLSPYSPLFRTHNAFLICTTDVHSLTIILHIITGNPFCSFCACGRGGFLSHWPSHGCPNFWTSPGFLTWSSLSLVAETSHNTSHFIEAGQDCQQGMWGTCSRATNSEHYPPVPPGWKNTRSTVSWIYLYWSPIFESLLQRWRRKS